MQTKKIVVVGSTNMDMVERSAIYRYLERLNLPDLFYEPGRKRC